MATNTASHNKGNACDSILCPSLVTTHAQLEHHVQIEPNIIQINYINCETELELGAIYYVSSEMDIQ